MITRNVGSVHGFRVGCCRELESRSCSLSPATAGMGAGMWPHPRSLQSPSHGKGERLPLCLLANGPGNTSRCCRYGVRGVRIEELCADGLLLIRAR